MKPKITLRDLFWLVLVLVSWSVVTADESSSLEVASPVIARGKTGIVSYFISQTGSIASKDCAIQLVLHSSRGERLALSAKDTSLQDAKGREVKIAVKQVGENSQIIKVLQDTAPVPWLLKARSSKESQVRMNLRIGGIVPVDQ